MILFGITGTTYAFCIHALHHLNHWISMGLLSKLDAFGFSVFHTAIFLKSLNTYGIADMFLYLVSMFSMILHPWNHWNSCGMAGKLLHMMYTNCTSKRTKLAFCLSFVPMCSLYIIFINLWLLAASKAGTASLNILSVDVWIAIVRNIINK